MAGGLMQLVAYGAQDVYLTGNPQITLFKVVYRRHTNFSMECIELPIGMARPSGRTSVQVLRNGDLASRAYLHVTLPDLAPTNSGFNGKIAWVKRLGHAIISNAEIQIGGSPIDKHWGVWLDIWYELTHTSEHEEGYKKLIGDVPELTTLSTSIDSNGYNLYIPFQFWFNTNYGLALPLIALQYHEVRINVEFEAIQNLIVYTSGTGDESPKFNNLEYPSASILMDYIYLDSEERRRFAQVGHEYLIEQVQFDEGNLTNSQSSQSILLNFNHPCKELIFTHQLGIYSGKNGSKFLGYTADDDPYAWKNVVQTVASQLTLGSLSTESFADSDLLENLYSGSRTTVKYGNMLLELINAANPYDGADDDFTTAANLFGTAAAYALSLIDALYSIEPVTTELDSTALTSNLTSTALTGSLTSTAVTGSLNNTSVHVNTTVALSDWGGSGNVDDGSVSGSVTNGNMTGNVTNGAATGNVTDGTAHGTTDHSVNHMTTLRLISNMVAANVAVKFSAVETALNNVSAAVASGLIEDIYNTVRIAELLMTEAASADAYAVDHVIGYVSTSYNNAHNSYHTTLEQTKVSIYGNTEVFVSKDGSFNPLMSVKNATVTWNGTELVISNVVHDLTIEDISSPVESFNDYRTENGDSRTDVTVVQLNYGARLDGKGNILKDGKLVLNGHDRFDTRDSTYFNIIQPLQHHTRIPTDGVNVYSFCLQAQQHQPTGTCNMSRIDDVRLLYRLADPFINTRKVPIDIYTGTVVNVYVRNFNVLRVMSGMAGLAYSN